MSAPTGDHATAVNLGLRAADACRYDAVALGEVMLRLDPEQDRIHTARTFRVWEGGGEYNVIRALRSTFGMRTAVVTALADNEIGRLIENLILTGGVDTSLIRWMPYDGIGQHTRNGLNFTERGFGVRGARGIYDRGHTAVSQIGPEDIDWDRLFGDDGVRWLHTGGVFAGLSEKAAETLIAATAAAKRYGAIVSYDPNYRPSLWRERGGLSRAMEVNHEVIGHVDILFDFTVIGEMYGSTGEHRVPSDLDDDELSALAQQVTAEHPNLHVLASTTRRVHSANRNDFGGLAWTRETGLVRGATRRDLEIFDRIGGGDGFVSGLVHGLMTGENLHTAVEHGIAHGALVMASPGDTSMATAAEVFALAESGTAHVNR